MRFVTLGVRGSSPAPGPDFVRYGGHTSCVAVLGDNDDVPLLVLDAGTGLRGLSALMDGAPFDGSIVLTHLHWDHLQGLPFSDSIDNPAARVRLHVPVESADVDVAALLARGFSPPHFPIGPDGLLGAWDFLPLLPGPVEQAMTVAPVPHKGGITFGIRVAMDGAVLAYLPDHALLEATTQPARAAVESLATGADVLLHDGQFLAAETDIARQYGHSTIEAALDFADRCRVGSVVLTHHAAGRTDVELDKLATRFTRTPEGRPVTFASQDGVVKVTATIVG
jgi:phosphoribosyl 1,2-cyclic phosphodiesterase